MSDKEAILKKVRAAVDDAHGRLVAAAKEAHDYATDPDSKAEGKYDTRSLEAGYLAAGQAEAASQLGEAVEALRDFDPPDFDPMAKADLGALVEAMVDGELTFYLLAPAGGGTSCEHLGCDVYVITPSAALWDKIVGLRPGDHLEKPELRVLSVS